MDERASGPVGDRRPGTSRRRALAVGVGALAAAPALGSCTGPGHGRPDPLVALAEAAERDAAEADAAFAAFPDLAAARAVGRGRRAQATALRKEIHRAAAETPTSTPATPKPRRPGGDRADAAARLSGRLRSAQDAAAGLVPTVPTYRAGLVGAVAAGCAAMRELFA